MEKLSGPSIGLNLMKTHASFTSIISTSEINWGRFAENFLRPAKLQLVCTIFSKLIRNSMKVTSYVSEEFIYVFYS